MNYLLHHHLRASAQRAPEQEALVDQKRRLTYREFAEQVSKLAQGLIAAGLVRGDRVGIWLEPSLEQAVSIYGVSQAQGVFVPIHHSLKSEQVLHITNDCGLKCLITTADHWRELPVAREVSGAASFQFLIQVGDSEMADTGLPNLGFASLTGSHAPSQPPTDVAIEKDLAAILYTSGSTGKPNGVMLSHANVMARASIVSDYLSLGESDRILAVLPFSFDAGLNQLTTGIQQGATVVMTSFRFAREIVTVLARERITGLAGVPPLWNLLVQPSSAEVWGFPTSKRNLPSISNASHLHSNDCSPMSPPIRCWRMHA